MHSSHSRKREGEMEKTVDKEPSWSHERGMAPGVLKLSEIIFAHNFLSAVVAIITLQG